MITIVNVAYPFAPLNEDTPGGAEQVVSCIDKEIVKRKYRSLVIAHEKSKVQGELIRVPELSACATEDNRLVIKTKVKKIIESTIKKYKPDLIHFHGIDFCDYLPQSYIVSVATLHLPIELYCKEKLNKSNLYFNCVSFTQHLTCLSEIKMLLPYIPNGVEIPLSMNRTCKKKTFALSLGRICPEKGYHHAIDAAKKAGVPIILAGEVYNYPEHIQYYEEQIKPRLTQIEHRFIGRVGRLQKEYLYNNARCVLIPSLIDETSSLVALEAMAHGTPVIAFKRGALVEIIKNDVNGFVVDNVEKMAEAIKSADKISAKKCHAIAKERYNLALMTNRYISMYMDLINKKN